MLSSYGTSTWWAPVDAVRFSAWFFFRGSQPEAQPEVPYNSPRCCRLHPSPRSSCTRAVASCRKSSQPRCARLACAVSAAGPSFLQVAPPTSRRLWGTGAAPSAYSPLERPQGTTDTTPSCSHSPSSLRTLCPCRPHRPASRTGTAATRAPTGSHHQ